MSSAACVYKCEDISTQKSSSFTIWSAFSECCSQPDSSLEIQTLPPTTSREHNRNTSIGYDHGKNGAHGVQICLYDAWHGVGREDIANVRGTRVDDCEGIDTRGKSRKLVQKQVAED